MQTLLVEVESPAKAKELSSLLQSINFVKKVSTLNKSKQMLEALQEHEDMKKAVIRKKNKAIAKYI